MHNWTVSDERNHKTSDDRIDEAFSSDDKVHASPPKEGKTGSAKRKAGRASSPSPSSSSEDEDEADECLVRGDSGRIQDQDQDQEGSGSGRVQDQDQDQEGSGSGRVQLFVSNIPRQVGFDLLLKSFYKFGFVDRLSSRFLTRRPSSPKKLKCSEEVGVAGGGCGGDGGRSGGGCNSAKIVIIAMTSGQRLLFGKLMRGQIRVHPLESKPPIVVRKYYK